MNDAVFNDKHSDLDSLPFISERGYITVGLQRWASEGWLWSETGIASELDLNPISEEVSNCGWFNAGQFYAAPCSNHNKYLCEFEI